MFLSACKTSDVRTDVAARISNPTAESRAEILHVIGDALDSREVTIAGDAFTESSLLIIEPAHLMGRDLRKPEHFQLVLNGLRCVLVHQETGARFELAHTSCVAE
jgi:hypothetical protein